MHFNSHRKGTKICQHKRCLCDREHLFGIYAGLFLYAKTRKRQLIDALFQYAICILYDRVLKISTQLNESVLSQFMEDVVVFFSHFQS